MKSSEFQRLPKAVQDIIQDYQIDVPVKLGALARELGLAVMSGTLPSGVSGEIRPDSATSAGFKIRVNRHEDRNRQRFTLAHEIAHYLLHRDQIGEGVRDDVLFRSNLSDSREAQANRLAADLIMPWQRIQEELLKLKDKSIDERVSALSDNFKVSTTAMKIRLDLLE